MLGDLTLNVSMSAAVLLAALWLVARHEADLDWSKLLIVSAVTGMLSVVPPMFVWSSLLERFQWDLTVMWPLILLATLAWQIGVFVMMLNRYVWVPIPKALLAWVIVQALLMAKDCAFALLKGQPILGSAWTSVTGMESPAAHREAALRAAEEERRMGELKKAALEGDVGAMIEAVEDEDEPSVPVISPATTNVTVVVATSAPAVQVVTESSRDVVPAKQVAVAATAMASVALIPAAVDLEREATRQLLVVKGISKQGGKVVVLVNGRMVGVGDTVTVNHNGRRYLWRLAGVEANQPIWE